MKYANTHEICKYTYLGVFWFGHFTRYGIKSKKQFFDKVLYNYCSKNFLKRFVPKNCVPKMDFPLYFQKMIWVGDIFCDEIFFLKKPNTPKYAQVSVVTCPKANSVDALLSPPPCPYLRLKKLLHSMGFYGINTFYGI